MSFSTYERGKDVGVPVVENSHGGVQSAVLPEVEATASRHLHIRHVNGALNRMLGGRELMV